MFALLSCINERKNMTKYLINRIIRGLFSIVIVVAIVMLLIYTFMDRNLIFATDGIYQKQKSNNKEIYKMQTFEKYGYVDYIPYTDYLKELLSSGEISEDIYNAVSLIGNAKDGSKDDAQTAEYIRLFTEKYENMGYDVVRLAAEFMPKTQKYKEGGQPRLYAYRDIPLLTRLWDYLSGLITIDNIHYVKEDIDNRGISFTWFDPAYGGEKFSPAIMGNGTRYKYLLYFDDSFPYLHQNLIKISLGTSYSVNQGNDVFDTMTESQGKFKTSIVHYPSGLVEESADDLHTAQYLAGSLKSGTVVVQSSFVDDYTSITTRKSGLSKIGYSFIIGLISVILAYMLAIPLGTWMALKKGKLVDKLGTIYIIFIIAVPSLAYIFLFRAIGTSAGLPSRFNVDDVGNWAMYILPIISLALPSVASLMKWLRRYMIDQMNSDYVKFARSGGLSEGEIFRKHILKNAMIPIVHGIPGSVLGALVGAIITERVYVVPGAGNLLTEAINMYDNGVIVGVTLFYALLSVISIILGDILMSLIDPRISFSTKSER